MPVTTPTLSSLLPWRTRISLAVMSYFTDFARRSDGTLNRRILQFIDTTTTVPPQTKHGVKVTDITIDSSKNLWFRLFVPTDIPAGSSKLPVLVFFHGGGFTFLSPNAKAYSAVCRRFARKIPAIVVSVNYRLTPEFKFPAAYDDGFETLKFLDMKGGDVLPENADLSRCFLAGDSAGANLAHNVARRYAESESEFSQLKLIGLISIQPFFGGEERTESEKRLIGAPLITLERTDWHWKAFLPEGADRDHEAVNVFGPKSTDISGLKSFPPVLVFVGGFDPLQDWQKRYCEGLKKCGKKAKLIEYPNAFHAFYVFPEVPESSLLCTEIVDFIQIIVGDCLVGVLMESNKK
ncbi:hypothetical protein ACHQM5_022498 [Ranunculus cassubicifolius]